MKGISVIICCYNSGSKLPTTLLHLAKQTTIPNVPYEIVLVNNNCTDDTVAVADRCWKKLGELFPLRIVAEAKAGLNFARINGVQSAAYEYIVFCDDDNWLCEDYLFKTYHHFEVKNEVAMVGGVGIAEFETQPPAWFEAIKGFGYAVGDEGRQTGYVSSLYGAGMALRKSVFLYILSENILFLSDRNGRQLSSGGDTEICHLVSRAGHRIYLDCSMTFQHFLTQSRLNWSYYLKLRKSFGMATAQLQCRIVANKKRNQSRQVFSLAKYCFRNWRYTIFPLQIKTSRCADFVQQKSMRIAMLKVEKR